MESMKKGYPLHRERQWEFLVVVRNGGWMQGDSCAAGLGGGWQREKEQGVGEEGPREVTGNKAKHLMGLNVLRELHFRSWG